jgi:hypothetical protein
MWCPHRTKGNCPAFCCKDFCVLFMNSSFMLLSVFNSTVQSIPCQSNNRWQVRQWRHLNHIQGFRRCWVCCTVSFVEVHLIVWLQRGNLHHGTGIRIRLLTHIHLNLKTFLLQSDRRTETTHDITDTNCTQWSDNTNCWPSVHVVHSFTRDPSGLQKQKHTRSKRLNSNYCFCNLLFWDYTAVDGIDK